MHTVSAASRSSKAIMCNATLSLSMETSHWKTPAAPWLYKSRITHTEGSRDHQPSVTALCLGLSVTAAPMLLLLLPLPGPPVLCSTSGTTVSPGRCSGGRLGAAPDSSPGTSTPARWLIAEVLPPPLLLLQLCCFGHCRGVRGNLGLRKMACRYAVRISNSSMPMRRGTSPLRSTRTSLCCFSSSIRRFSGDTRQWKWPVVLSSTGTGIPRFAAMARSAASIVLASSLSSYARNLWSSVPSSSEISIQRYSMFPFVSRYPTTVTYFFRFSHHSWPFLDWG
mmetsp:Transcript_33218/g.94117  ORF Transcript_33218/g.94117 Transcript_33218/m.94117 type:complete len:280 (-) Transcript_33218:1051-1890(-)